MRGPAAAAEQNHVAQPFLTDAQRAALDAALAAKQLSSEAAAKSKIQHHKPTGHTSDRKSKTGKGTGAAKKGGGGGKFTWGSALDGAEEEVIDSLDRNDPNYDSDDERNFVYQTQQSRVKEEVLNYKAEVVKIVNEYFSSGDIQEVSTSLVELEADEFMYYFVKKLLTIALDRKDREREMASVLLSSLYGEVVPPDQVRKGFLSLMESLEDLLLDVPDAVELLATFVARSVVDDVLPPSLIRKLPTSDGTALAELQHKVQLDLGARHSAERLLRCWGAGAGISYAETRDSIVSLLHEYTASGDVDEARRCLRALAVPFFHHELVKRAVHVALEQPTVQAAIINLLTKLQECGDVSPQQMHKGFRRVVDSLEDTSLDNPQAPDQFSLMLEAARAAGLVDDSFEVVSCSTASNAGSTNGHASHTHSVHAFKVATINSLKEYFDSKDAEEVARRLAELDEPGLHHILVKHAVQLAMDRKDREREMVSSLLSVLYPKTISADAMAMGFTRLLASAGDVVLDMPDAVHLLSLFLGRAIVDELLPPAFLTQVLPALRNDSLGVGVVRATASILSARHAAERLQNCWHGGVLTLDQIKAAMKVSLAEYIVSGDVAEASKCLMELSVPCYHHEYVLLALQAGFGQPSAAGSLLRLLAALADSGAISATQMSKGFSRVAGRLDDLQLDFPSARSAYDAAVAQATLEGWLMPASEPAAA